MKKITKLTIIVGALLLLSSCSRWFLHTHVTISSDKDAVVYSEGIKVSKVGESFRNIRDASVPKVREYEIVKSRHKIRTETIYPAGFNVGLLSALPLLGLDIYPNVAGTYSRSFAKKWDFPLTPYPDLEHAHHHISFKSIDLDDSLRVPKYFTKRVGKYKKKKKLDGIFKEKGFERNLVEYKKGNIRERLNLFLEEIGTESTNNIAISNYQEYSIYADISSIKLKEINFYRAYEDFMKLEVETVFFVLNNEGDTIMNKSITSESGHFREFKDNVEYYMLVDALDYATIELLNTPKLFKLLKNKETKTNHHKTTGYITQASKQSTIKDVYDQYFTLSAGGDSLKSVCLPVGKDGLLIASSLGLDYSNENFVYNKDSVKYKFEIIKEIPGQEIALIKIDTVFTSTFKVASNTPCGYR